MEQRVVRVSPRIAISAGFALAALLGAGCVNKMDPAVAREQFSSKERSMAAAGNRSIAPRRATPEAEPVAFPVGEAPPVLSTPGVTDGAASPVPDSVRADAASILRQAAKSNWAALRAHAIEASVHNRALLAELAPRGFADENRGVRFVACMSAAEARANDLAPMIEPLVADESASVRAAAMLALSRAGRKVDISPLATMAFDSDPEIRANAYLVLGELGNRSAIPVIRESLGQGMGLLNPIRVRLVGMSAAEALVKLGDDAQIEPIRAALFAPPQQAELTVVACDALGRLGDEIARPMLERLVTGSGESLRSPEVRIAAARALARLSGGPKAGALALATGAPKSADSVTFSMALGVAKDSIGSSDGRVRAQVAGLLSEIGSPEAAALLAGLIRDSDPVVQVAAAGGLDAAD